MQRKFHRWSKKYFVVVPMYCASMNPMSAMRNLSGIEYPDDGYKKAVLELDTFQ